MNGFARVISLLSFEKRISGLVRPSVSGQFLLQGSFIWTVQDSYTHLPSGTFSPINSKKKPGAHVNDRLYSYCPELSSEPLNKERHLIPGISIRRCLQLHKENYCIQRSGAKDVGIDLLLV